MTWQAIHQQPPAEDIPVLVYAGGYVTSVIFSSDGWIYPFGMDDEACFDFDPNLITHWQGLPEPPKDHLVRLQ